MKYISHSIGSISFGMVAASVIATQNTEVALELASLVLGASIFGGLFPDIDHPNSYISKKIPLVSIIVQLFLFINKLFINIICKFNKNCILYKKEFEHRGVFHSLLFAIIFSLLIGLIPYSKIIYVQFGFFIGYLSHLMMDMLTVSGVKIFFPFTTKSFHYPIIRLHTGNVLHEIIASGIFIAFSVSVYFYIFGLIL